MLTIDYPPMGGGMARHCADVCAALKRSDVSVTVIAPAAPEGREAPAGGIPADRVRSVRPGRIFDHYILSALAFYFRALGRCAADRPEMVLTNTWSVAGVAALFIKKTVGVPYAVFAHGLDIYSSIGPNGGVRVRWLMKAVLDNACVVIANSSFTKALAGPVTDSDKVKVLNPTVSPEVLAYMESVAPVSRPERQQEILTVGRLVESKGHDVVIRSMPRVLEKFPDAVYRIVGSGPREAELRSLAAACGIAGRVIFEGEVDGERLAECYHNCDIFAMTSREVPSRGEVEGFGIVFLEAAVFSKPSIGSRSGGIPDAIEDGVTGILVEPGNPDAVSVAAIKLLSDPGLAERMGRAGRQRAEKSFSPESFASKLNDIISGAVAP